jgi:glycoside/pentoside/hexuronide:cation symporter, GPH family
MSERKLSMREKLSYGFGGFVDQIMSGTFGMMAFPIYNIALGLDARLLGIALSVPRFVDALTDPIMGHISDNTRSRWGRRKPYIALGAILMAVMLVLVFTPPAALTAQGLFWYITITGALMYVAYTVFAVPYNALGYELTQDYDERTSVQAWRMVMISIKAVAAPWILKACFVIGGWFPAGEQPVEVIGVFYVALGLGVLVMIGTLPILMFCREATEQVQKAKVKAFESIKATLSNKVFRVHLVTIFMVMIGVFIFGPLKIYLNNFYVYGGDKDAAATMIGYSGSLQAIFGFLSIPLITWLSKRIGKKATYSGGIIASGLIFPFSWFVYTPDMPYLQLIIPILTAPAITCCWVLNPSITADICDHDELQTGQRREGMFGAVWGFAFKAGISGISLVMGVMIAWTGFAADITTQSDETIFRMRLLMVVIPLIFLAGGGLYFALCFPLTRARMVDIQEKLKSSNKDE